MPALLAFVALLLLLPAVGLGVAAVGLVLTAALLVGLTSIALGATGCLFNWILAALAVGISCRGVQSCRRFVARVRHE